MSSPETGIIGFAPHRMSRPAAPMKPAATKHPSTRHWTASNRLLWPVLEALRAHGHTPAQILKRADVDERLAETPDGRIPLHGLFAVWRLAIELTQDEALGVKLAAIANPSATYSWPMPLSLFEHIGMTSRNLAEAIETQSRYARLLRDGAQASLHLDGETASFRLELLPDEPPALIEQMFAVMLNIARRVARRELNPTEVWFSHRAPKNTELHQAVFQAPIRYEAPFNALFGPSRVFLEPLQTASAVAHTRVLSQADKLLLDLPNVAQFEDTVCAQIETELPHGNTNSASVAERLGVSGRTLHRRLHERGTTYQELLDRVRLRLASRLLAAGRPIADVAASVGFSQASTFHRAFKSWTGQTPTEYQQRCLNGSYAAGDSKTANGED
jgi:AraC-like DNA-binding protein